MTMSPVADKQFLLRPANETDAADIAAIYRPIVEQTVISFETEPPSEEEMQKRIRAVQNTHLWLVCEHGHRVVGYAYGGPHRARKAYQWATEVSVYVASGYRQLGLARALYTALLKALEKQGYTVALAGITLPNTASENFHLAMGFQEFARFERIGYKFGQWHDTMWMRKDLGEREMDVRSPASHAVVTGSGVWQTILEESLGMIHG